MGDHDLYPVTLKWYLFISALLPCISQLSDTDGIQNNKRTICSETG